MMFLKKKHKTKTVPKKQSSHSKKNREKKKIRHKSSTKGNKKKRFLKDRPKVKKSIKKLPKED